MKLNMIKNNFRIWAFLIVLVMIMTGCASGGKVNSGGSASSGSSGSVEDTPADDEDAEDTPDEDVDDEDADDGDDAGATETKKGVPAATGNGVKLYTWDVDEEEAEDEDVEESSEEYVYTDDDLVEMTLYGEIFLFTEEHPNGTTIDATGLKLDEPIIIDTEFTGRVEVEEVHLAESSNFSGGSLSDYEGQHVMVTGEGLGAHTAWHLRDLVLLTDNVFATDDYFEDYEGTMLDELDPGYYLDVEKADEAYRLLYGRWYAYSMQVKGDDVLTPDDMKDHVIYYEFDKKGKTLYGDGKSSDGELPADSITELKAAFKSGDPDIEMDHYSFWPTDWYIELKGYADAKDGKAYATMYGRYLYVVVPGDGDKSGEYVFAKNSTDKDGEELTLTKDTQREANLFLSNFAEQEQGAFSFSGKIDPVKLMRFAFDFAKINTPEKIKTESGTEFLSMKDCNGILERYTPFFIPEAEEKYLESDGTNTDIDYVWCFDGKAIRGEKEEEPHNTFAVANAMYRERGNIRIIYYDLYELDIVEYLDRGIDKSYYELSAKDAEKNTSLKKIGKGRAVAETYHVSGRDSYRLIEMDSALRVSTAAELIKALGSERTIELEEGVYNITKELEKGRLDVWDEDVSANFVKGIYSSECYDGKELILCGLSNLTLRPVYDNGAYHHVEIICEPRYANVFTFFDSYDIHMEKITMGHTDGGYCAGSVLKFDNSGTITLDTMDLYGCGTYGIEAWSVYDLSATGCTIRDCTYGCLDMYDSYAMEFGDSVFYNSGEFSALSVYRSAAYFGGCSFYDLEGGFIGMDDESYLTFSGCEFDKDALSELKSNEFLDERVYVYR